MIAGGAKNPRGLISREMAKLETKIIVHYHSNKAKNDAEETVSVIKSSGGDALGIQSDLTKVENVKKLWIRGTPIQSKLGKGNRFTAQKCMRAP